MDEKFVDLHIHTHASDGTATASEIVREAAENGLAAMAITDHDSVESIDEAIICGRETGVEIVTGVELSATALGEEIHVLGYLFDHRNERFLGYLERFVKFRRDRVAKIGVKLNDLGVNVDVAPLVEKAQKTAVGRLHVARLLVEKGYVKTFDEAFRKYLGNQAPAHVGKYRLSVSEACEIISSAGGLPFLAHPCLIRRDGLVMTLIKEGIVGLEVFYGNSSDEIIRYYHHLAEQNNLLISGGSDSHQNNKENSLLGTVKVPYRYLHEMKDAVEHA